MNKLGEGKTGKWLDSNPGPLVSRAISLPTVAIITTFVLSVLTNSKQKMLSKQCDQLICSIYNNANLPKYEPKKVHKFKILPKTKWTFSKRPKFVHITPKLQNFAKDTHHVSKLPITCRYCFQNNNTLN